MIIARAFSVACIIAMIGLAAMFYALFYEPAPISTASRQVAEQTVKRGETLTISNSAIFDKSCAAVIYRAVYDKKGTRVFTDTEIRPANALLGQTTPTRSIPVPDFAAPGPAQYRVMIEWQCNFVQRLWPNVKELPVLNFTVTP